MSNFNQAVGEWDSSTINEIQQYIKSSYVNIHTKLYTHDKCHCANCNKCQPHEYLYYGRLVMSKLHFWTESYSPCQLLIECLVCFRVISQRQCTLSNLYIKKQYQGQCKGNINEITPVSFVISVYLLQLCRFLDNKRFLPDLAMQSHFFLHSTYFTFYVVRMSKTYRLSTLMFTRIISPGTSDVNRLWFAARGCVLTTSFASVPVNHIQRTQIVSKFVKT